MSKLLFDLWLELFPDPEALGVLGLADVVAELPAAVADEVEAGVLLDIEDDPGFKV